MFSDILLTVDFDRTLTDPQARVPERNLEAIRYFTENGGAFTVNTGRSIPTAKSNIFPLQCNNVPLLLYNGSAIYDTDKAAFTRTTAIDLDPRELVEVVQCKFPELRIEIQGTDAHYLFIRDRIWEDYCRNNLTPWAYQAPEEIPGPFLKFAIYAPFLDNTVASMYGAAEPELAMMQEAIDFVLARWGHKLEYFRACARIADFQAKGCSKLNSARQLQKDLGRKLLICVGDAENDLTMLRGADFAYCPADGVVADQFENVCQCAEGAVADVIYRKIPEILKNKP